MSFGLGSSGGHGGGDGGDGEDVGNGDCGGGGDAEAGAADAGANYAGRGDDRGDVRVCTGGPNGRAWGEMSTGAIAGTTPTV